MSYIDSNYEYPKALAQLLRKSIDDLKNVGIKIITQTTTKEDWDNYLKDKTSWKIKMSRNDPDINCIVIIECDIDNF